jgi:S-adenosylmethionine synthetase
MAREIVTRGEGDIIEAHVKLLSQIGRPITDPWVNSIELIPADNVNFNSVYKIATEVSAEKLSKENLINLRLRLIEGKEQVF